jgi:hypothetical protein
MDKDTALKMIALTAKNGELTRDEFKFVTNHISTFVGFVIERATADLVSAGIEQELAESMLGTISGLSKMAGVQEYHDFAEVARMLGEAGDNA